MNTSAPTRSMATFRHRVVTAMTLLFILCALTASDSFAAEKSGITMPDTWEYGDSTLQLNGLGVREYGIFKTDVYVAALYVTEKTADSNAILNTDAPRVLHMQYKRSGGDTEGAREAWTHYLRANCEALSCEWPQAAVDQFLSWVGPAKKGETETFVFVDGTAQYAVGDTQKGTVDDAVFAKILLASWIGPAPSTEKLRAGLLGE